MPRASAAAAFYCAHQNYIIQFFQSNELWKKRKAVKRKLKWKIVHTLNKWLATREARSRISTTSIVYGDW